MLKHRLMFGTLMATLFVGLALLDGWLDGSISDASPDAPIQAILFTLLVVLLAIPAHIELDHLVRQTGAHLFKSVTIPASMLMATLFFWDQFLIDTRMYLLILPAAVLVLFGVQAITFGTEGTIRNIAASVFSILYLGFFCAFIVGIRVQYGVWVLLFFVFTIKSSDIGAYAFGRRFGKHRLCPSISPGKTWEGLAGAVGVAAGVSIVFSHFCDIMPVLQAAVFGAVFGVLGQAGDLVESMIKRDAASKDSSNRIPGFGGLLDVIDSPLATAPIAFAVFMYVL